MTGHELRRFAGKRDRNTRILKGPDGDRNIMVNACRFSVKTGGPQYVHTLRSPGSRKNIGQIRWSSKTAKDNRKQRKTANNPAVVPGPDGPEARISAANGMSLAVNFREEPEFGRKWDQTNRCAWPRRCQRCRREGRCRSLVVGPICARIPE